MKSFKNFITEKKARNFGTKGGDGGVKGTRITPEDRSRASANKQDPSRAQSGGKPKTFTSPTERGVSYTTNAPDETVLGGKTPEQADQEITAKQKQRGTQPSSAKTQRELKGFGKDIQTTPETKSGGRTASPSRPRGATAKPGDLESFMRNQQSKGNPVTDTLQDIAGRKGGGYDFPRNVGTEKPKPTKPGSYVVDTKAVKQAQASKRQALYRAKEGERVIKSIQRSGNQMSRMRRGYSKNLAATGDAIINQIRADKKAETVAGNKEFKRSRYGYRKSGPATNLRTPAKTKTYKTGVQKGYFDPKTGRISERGLQKHVNMRTVGGENFGKFKGKDPRSALKSVENIVSRAAGGDKAARSQVRRSYKAITKKYAPETGARAARQATSGFKSFQQQTRNIDAPKLKPQKMSMPLPGTTPRPVSSPAAQATKERVRQKLDLKIADRAVKSKSIVPAQSAAIGSSPKGSTSTPSKGTSSMVSTRIEPVKVEVEAPKTSSKNNIRNFLRKTAEKKGLISPSRQSNPTRQPNPYRGAGVGSKVTVGSGKAVGTSQIVPYTPPKSPSKGKTATVTDLSDAGFAKGRPGTRTYSPSIAKASKVKNALRGAGRVLGPAAAIADVGLTYKDARDAGYTRGQSVKRTAAQVGSGSAGGWAGAKAGALTGAKIGAFLGLKGAAIGAGIGGIVGGIGGYMAGRGLATKVLDKTMKPKEYRPKVNQQQVQNTANNVKNNTFTPKVNPTTGQRYIGDKDIKRLGLKTAAEIQNIKKPKPKIKKASIPLNASFSPLEEYILETSDAMLKSGYTIDETVDFWTIEDEDLVEKVLSSLTLTESVSYDDDLYVVCERVGALRSLGSWALKQASRLKGAFSRGSGSTVNVTRSQTRGGIFNTGILKKIFKPKVQVTGRGIQKPPRKLGTAGKIGALGALGLGLGLAGKSIYDAENRDPIKSNIEVDPDGEVKAGPESNPNTPTAQGWWKKSHYGNPVQQIPYRYNKHTQKLNSSGNVVNK